MSEDITKASTPTKIPSGKGWEWLHAYVDGADITVHDCSGTRFGGTDDTADNGIGASGFNIRANPQLYGVALPQSGRGLISMRGCPIPKVAWYCPIKVYSVKTGIIQFGSLVDLGPSVTTKKAIDLTNSLVEALGLSLDDGVYQISYRIMGGAKFLRKTA